MHFTIFDMKQPDIWIACYRDFCILIPSLIFKTKRWWNPSKQKDFVRIIYCCWKNLCSSTRSFMYYFIMYRGLYKATKRTHLLYVVGNFFIHDLFSSDPLRLNYCKHSPRTVTLTASWWWKLSRLKRVLIFYFSTTALIGRMRGCACPIGLNWLYCPLGFVV